ncbi:BspA family leucine-rich repeat surface protein [Fulvivirga sp. M361]|uniref:BspA family leucine-rich repeat surface protein n=1 Tax=Fulvivirga sp. M361 TaxID=2594266 RepID=UPI00117AF997|nr:BspA family leucine-rich repeat surface protein [Fulvivirga sp. M361]TRX58666.1 BspA family leucine-rich repeat surface protein [Fulvivirga sp. M361]
MRNNTFNITILVITMALWACGDDDTTEPVNTAPSMSAQSFSVSEAVGDTDIIGTVTATDPEDDELTFSITTNDNDLFEIASAGALSLATGKGLDFEMTTSHTITVQVSDGEFSVSTTITISVLDISENTMPTIAPQTFSVAEDIDDITEIGTVVATDAESNELTFTITTNDDDLFEISEVGVLSLAAGQTLDFETKKSHSISVEVSDGVLAASSEITVNVTDVSEIASVPFITTWETTADNESITIPIDEFNFTYNYNVDWGDGSTSSNQTGGASHTYATAGTYTVSITGLFPAIYFFNKGDKDKIRTITQWGDNSWKSMRDAFRGCSMLTYAASDIPDLSQVTNMNSMFTACSSFNGAIGNWDVSNVTTMAFMFASATSFNQDLDDWDVSNVTSMSTMFSSASSFNRDLNKWDVSNVTRMSLMFNQASSFNGNISNWDVSNVTSMGSMFSGATAFKRNLNSWDVSSVTSMQGMFSRSFYNSDIGDWDVSNVTNMEDMFNDVTPFNQDISGWDVSSVTNMEEMFYRAFGFNQNLGNWNIENVANMSDMLRDSGLSIANYDATLQGWSQLPIVQSGVRLGAFGLVYCDIGEAAIAVLETKGWIVGGRKGLGAECE